VPGYVSTHVPFASNTDAPPLSRMWRYALVLFDVVPAGKSLSERTLFVPGTPTPVRACWLIVTPLYENVAATPTAFGDGHTAKPVGRNGSVTL
jgi:hypothetical protein